MKQFDVYPNPSPRSRGRLPWVMVVQSHLFEAHTMLVAPLLPQDGRSTFTEISVSVRLDDVEHIVLLGELAAVETRLLQRPVANLVSYEDAIRRALDRIFTGF